MRNTNYDSAIRAKKEYRHNGFQAQDQNSKANPIDKYIVINPTKRSVYSKYQIDLENKTAIDSSVRFRLIESSVNIYIFHIFNLGYNPMQSSNNIDEMDMFAAQIGEGYSNSHIKEYCLEATNGNFGVQFMQCFRRSSYLINKYFKKISEITNELSLQEQGDLVDKDPSYFKSKS